jgi:hypothetical protein
VSFVTTAAVNLLFTARVVAASFDRARFWVAWTDVGVAKPKRG